MTETSSNLNPTENFENYILYIEKFLRKARESGNMQEYLRLLLVLRDTLNDTITKVDKYQTY